MSIPVAMSAGRSMRPSDGCRCALFVGPDKHRPLRSEYGPSYGRRWVWSCSHQEAATSRPPVGSRIGVRGLPRQQSTSRVPGAGPLALNDTERRFRRGLVDAVEHSMRPTRTIWLAPDRTAPNRSPRRRSHRRADGVRGVVAQAAGPKRPGRLGRMPPRSRRTRTLLAGSLEGCCGPSAVDPTAADD